MVSRYKIKFDNLASKKQKAFIPYAMLGWPDPSQSLSMMKQMIKSGASALELGIAFSDPVADGPIIQQANYQTIESGFTTDNAFDLIKQVRKFDNDIPIGILVYFNIVLSYGVNRFFNMAKESGVDGVLIADLPAENAVEVKPAAETAGIDLIFLISPVTPINRLESILEHASGFLYLVSRLGVTGISERSVLDDRVLKNLVNKVKEKSKLPVCAGFGISSENDAKSMFNVGVDGVISASRIISIVQNAQAREIPQLLDEYYSRMIAACAITEQMANLCT